MAVNYILAYCKILNFIRQPRTGTSAQISQFERFLLGGSILFMTPYTCSLRLKQTVSGTIQLTKHIDKKSNKVIVIINLNKQQSNNCYTTVTAILQH